MPVFPAPLPTLSFCSTPPVPSVLLLLSRYSRVWLCATPETAAHQAPLSLDFSRQEHWSELPFPSPRDLLHPETETASALAPALTGGFLTTEPPWLRFFEDKVPTPIDICENMYNPVKSHGHSNRHLLFSMAAVYMFLSRRWRWSTSRKVLECIMTSGKRLWWRFQTTLCCVHESLIKQSSLPIKFIKH